jgi:colanic acid/amylovoran biosynthesis glycosyltransferase
MSKQPRHIAYVMQSFPLLTETFIYREVLGLKRRGFCVATFAIRKPDKNRLSQEAWHLVDSSHYVFPISWPRFLGAHIYFLCTCPAKYLSTLFFVLTRRGESISNRMRTFLHFGGAVYLAMEMKKQRVRHIHAHFAVNAATVALVASRLLDITFSFTAHNIVFIDRVILKEKVRAARFIVTISEFTRQFLIRLVPENSIEDKIHIVHCGLSPDDFMPPDSKPVNDVPVVLCVAQLVERKGIPILVEACKLLSERGGVFRCVIIGHGLQRALVERLIEQYALQEVVELAGVVFQEDLKKYLERADVFVLPCVTASNGDMDGIPVVLMEAMAMEIPTVSTRVSGIPELIEDGESGLLVEEKDPIALADAVQCLLKDRGLRVKLGKNGRRRVVEEFDIDRNVAQLAALFEKNLATFDVAGNTRRH